MCSMTSNRPTTRKQPLGSSSPSSEPQKTAPHPCRAIAFAPSASGSTATTSFPARAVALATVETERSQADFRVLDLDAIVDEAHTIDEWAERLRPPSEPTETFQLR